MASMIEELLSVMKKEDAVYRKMLPVAEEKTRVIIKNDLQALQEITEREQLVVEKINSLERKREEVIVNIGTVLGRNPSTLTMKVLIRLLEKQPEEQRMLSEIYDSLLTTVKKLSAINERNQILIQQSLEMIEFNMNLIQSTRMSPGINNYTKGASEQVISPNGTGTFDAKQ